jgi:archaellum component FlaG (FlaF/FlaG flagellin family)
VNGWEAPVEIKIGVQNIGREIVLESNEDADSVAKIVEDAITKGSELRLKDDKGRLIIVPGNALGYVEIGAEEARRVGFGQF